MTKPKFSTSTSTISKTNTLLLATTTASLLTTYTTATPLLNPRHNTAQTALTTISTTTTTTTGGASCTAHVPFDTFTKDDWDFCCLQEYGAPSMTSARTAGVFTDRATASDGKRVAEGEVELRCELRADYAESLEDCFREFAGVWEGFGCAGIAEFDGDGEKVRGQDR